MSELIARKDIKMASIEAIVTRADGTVEDLGTIAYYHKNPLKRLQFRISEIFRHGNRSR